MRTKAGVYTPTRVSAFCSMLSLGAAVGSKSEASGALAFGMDFAMAKKS